MVDMLPREVLDGLERARRAGRSGRSRLRVEIDGRHYPVRRHWDQGIALSLDDAPPLRGLVDLYDGARHVSQCLIVASSEEDGEVHYEFKRATPVTDRAALDFAKEASAPTALIARD